MTEDIFISKNNGSWERLAEYNRMLSKRKIGRLSDAELREFTELIRITGRHLAYARTVYPNGGLPEYLNRLVGLSHNYFYIRETYGISRVVRYLRAGFPNRVREEYKLLLASAAVFFAGLLFVYAICGMDPSLIAFFIEEDAAPSGALPGSWTYPALSSFVVTNNIRVAFTAFAFGFSAGIGTLYILFANGGVLGAYMRYLSSDGAGLLRFWSLILPHGAAELTAVFICGAAGLMIGRAVIMPGVYSRKDAVVTAAKRAVYTLPGVSLILLFAGLTEGFFTPLDIAYGWKYLFAGLTLLFLLSYFIFCGRNKATDNGLQPPSRPGRPAFRGRMSRRGQST